MMKRTVVGDSRFAAMLVLLIATMLAAGPARAVKIDTLTGLPPGTTIGCLYTFQNGDDPIPCPTEKVDDDGKVKFEKREDIQYDNLEYFMIPLLGGPNLPILKLQTPQGQPIVNFITNDSKFPLLTPDGTFDSFFDVFVTIDLPTFSLFDSNGLLDFGSTCTFATGVSDDCPGISIESFTGVATVAGLDLVSVPEPGTLGLLLVALIILAAATVRYRWSFDGLSTTRGGIAHPA